MQGFIKDSMNSIQISPTSSTLTEYNEPKLAMSINFTASTLSRTSIEYYPNI